MVVKPQHTYMEVTHLLERKQIKAMCTINYKLSKNEAIHTTKPHVQQNLK